MSDGDPSLEEDCPARLMPNAQNSFKGKTVFTGSPLRIPLPNNDIQETVAFLNDAQKDSQEMQKLSKEGVDGYFEMDGDTDKKPSDLQAMSVLSMYPDNLSQEMNTDRDNGSEASTREAEENGHMESEPPAPAEVPCKERRNHCNITMRSAEENPSLFFNDGIRSVDFVLVWEALKESSTTPLARHRREIYEANLEEQGLELEREAPENLRGLNFVKIHAPLSVLRKYGEILKLRMPMKEELCKIEKGGRHNAILNAALFISKMPALKDVHTKTNALLDKVNDTWDRIMHDIRVDTEKFPERSHRFTAIYSRDKEYLFDVKAPCFWTASSRSRIVQFILDRQRFSRDKRDDFAFGIERLIAQETYSAAYPLHDGDLKTPGSMRHLLYKEWASVKKCLHYQPLDYVKDYFGVKIGLYFAWLGFYTHMLIPASLVGLICFIYSVSTLYSNIPSEDVCHDNSSIKMCPLCDHWCDYWSLKETCLHSRVTYLFDNPTTVFFAIFMSFWATLFLEMWKRYSAEMTHRWDLTGFDIHEEHPRPQYLARLSHVKKKQLNVITDTLEPQVPFWRMRVPATMLSVSAVVFLITLALATVLGVVLYRMSLLTVLTAQGHDSLITSYAILFTTSTAACINLCFICIFNYVYQFLAEWLTEKELLRTQTEFDDSLTLKIYLLQFVNYYASIFYIAFFKGKFVGRPGDYSRFLGRYRQEECGPGGCLMELCIQLAIIMVGKQAVNTVIEMLLPYLFRWLNILRTLGRGNGVKSSLQWVKDFKLVDFGHMGLFPEYLEMVLQYGFVTIFVAAFPLAPLFALLNNVLEMRLDAIKMLQSYRRPVPQRVRDIGVWYRILDSIGKLSVITNGFIIAFTSEFIPRLVYRMSETSADNSLNGYLNYTLAYFNVSDFEKGSAPHKTDYEKDLCRYPDYREPPWSEKPYKHTSTYWHVLGARLAFVVVFENVVALVMIIVRWLIPDMSSELRDRIRREAYVINEIIISREAREVANATQNRNTTDSQESHETVGNWNQLLSATLSQSDFDLACHAGAADARGNDPGTEPVHV